jgi:hypothetical protein
LILARLWTVQEAQILGDLADAQDIGETPHMQRRAHVFGGIVALTSLSLLVHCGDASFEDNASDAAIDGTSPSDSFIPDTSPISDGSVVTRADAASGVSPCAADASHWICDDFDRGGNLTDFPYWTSTNITDGGATLVMQPPGGSTPPTPPNALVAAAAADNEAVVFKQALISASGLSCDFDVRIDQDGADSYSDIALLSLYTPDGTYYRLNATLSPGGSDDGFSDYAGFPDAGAIVSTEETFAIPRHQWTHIRMQASLGPTGQVAVFVNGVTRHFTTNIDFTSFGQPTSASFQLGSANGDGSGASWEIVFDNAYCDVVP